MRGIPGFPQQSTAEVARSAHPRLKTFADNTTDHELFERSSEHLPYHGPKATPIFDGLTRQLTQTRLTAESIGYLGRGAQSAGPRGLVEESMEPRNSLGQPQPSGGEQVVQRLVFDATKPDLSLSPEQKDALRAIVLGVQAQPDTAVSGTRAAGVTALFVVPDSATAMKATAVLANELGRDAYRVDLGQVVSRYVGETEKNLTRVFDEAQRAGAVLFFDEADALFGKRTDVKDAHDRYANLDISYLLERLEAYEGLMILATNRRENVDDAFIRRIRYVVSFE